MVRDEAYFKTGGQRIAQVIVYLQAPEAGGCTKFFGSAFGETLGSAGLAAVPEVGKALVFPTATLRGEGNPEGLRRTPRVRRSRGARWRWRRHS